MADAATVKYVWPPDWDRTEPPQFVSRVKVLLQSVSDGTGEASVRKVVAGAFTLPTGEPVTRIGIDKVEYDVNGMVVELLWDRTPAERALLLTGSGPGEFCFEREGGLWDSSGEGGTGDLLLKTTAHTANDSYSILLTLRLA